MEKNIDFLFTGNKSQHKENLLEETRKKREERKQVAIEIKNAKIIQRNVRKWLKKRKLINQKRLNVDKLLSYCRNVKIEIKIIEKLLSHISQMSCTEDIPRILTYINLLSDITLLSNFIKNGTSLLNQELSEWVQNISSLFIISSQILSHSIRFPAIYTQDQIESCEKIIFNFLIIFSDIENWNHHYPSILLFIEKIYVSKLFLSLRCALDIFSHQSKSLLVKAFFNLINNLMNLSAQNQKYSDLFFQLFIKYFLTLPFNLFSSIQNIFQQKHFLLSVLNNLPIILQSFHLQLKDIPKLLYSKEDTSYRCHFLFVNLLHWIHIQSFSMDHALLKIMVEIMQLYPYGFQFDDQLTQKLYWLYTSSNLVRPLFSCFDGSEKEITNRIDTFYYHLSSPLPTWIQYVNHQLLYTTCRYYELLISLQKPNLRYHIIHLLTTSSPLLYCLNQILPHLPLDFYACIGVILSDSLHVFFFSCLFHFISIISDEDFENISSLMSFQSLRELTIILKHVCFYFIINKFHGSTFNTCIDLFHKLYERNWRVNYAHNSLWILSTEEINQWQDEWSQNKETSRTLLSKIYWTIPFLIRVQLFHQLVYKPYTHFYEIAIRRSHLVQDGFFHIGKLGSKLDQYGLKVRFIDDNNQLEEGIDLGGVFKEFLMLLIQEVFSSHYGLFIQNQQGFLFPNPEYQLNDRNELFEILGLIVGFSIRNQLTIGISFAHFFLARLSGQNCSFYDLKQYDRELYQNLMFIKDYEGDISDLSLTFSVTSSNFGNISTIDLIPNGRDIDVNNRSKLHYIYLVANYWLNEKHNEAINDFRRGFSRLVNPLFLAFFHPYELQTLFCGNEEKIDIDDWYNHTKYDSLELPVSSTTSVIKWFWEIVRKMNNDEQRQLLQFVTCSPRVPLLGFQNLDPPFTIRLVRLKNEKNLKTFLSSWQKMTSTQSIELPTASTCFHLLKIPKYEKKSQLKEKLLLAIKECNTGFGIA